jgi:hypothetical protein
MSVVTDIMIYGFPSKKFMDKLNEHMMDKYKTMFNKVSTWAGGDRATNDVYLAGINYFEPLDSFKIVLQGLLPLTSSDNLLVTLNNDNWDIPECLLIMDGKILPYVLKNSDNDTKKLIYSVTCGKFESTYSGGCNIHNHVFMEFKRIQSRADYEELVKAVLKSLHNDLFNDGSSDWQVTSISVIGGSVI